MHKAMLLLARGMAILGGMVLSALILITCLSILGRSLNTLLHADVVQSVAPGLAEWALALGIGPITGDFELVEAGTAFAIFAFLPLCQITGGHATVDIFTARLPDPVLRLLRALIEIAFAAALVLIAWRLFEGLGSKYRNGETTWLLQFPIWWSYAASFAGCAVAAVVGVYMAGLRVAELVAGRPLVPADPESRA